MQGSDVENLEKGYPAGNVANLLILRSLYEQDLRFEELVNRLRGRLSRGTVNKYLNALYESRDEFRDFVKRRGRRGSYYIPKEKRHEVKLFLDREKARQACNRFIDNATQQDIEALLKRNAELERIVRKLDAAMERMVRMVEEGGEK